MPKTMNWDYVHATPDGWYPNEFIVRFMAKFVRKRTGIDSYTWYRTDIKRVLDLGCGCGRHVLMLAAEGYETAGIDISHNGVDFARKWLASQGLSADLRVGAVQALPWADKYFDVVVSHGVLDHMLDADARLALSEVKRVLRPGGLLYCSLIASDSSTYGTGEEVEPGAFLIPDGQEAGLVQRYFTLDGVFKILEPQFTVLDVVHDCWRPCHGKGFSELEQENPTTNSRFHIAAQLNAK